MTEPVQELIKEEDLPPLKKKHSQVMALVLSGDKPTAAYQQVYDCGDKTAREASSRLMAKGNFKLHLSLAREQIAQSSKLSHGWVLDRLKGIVRDCLNNGKGHNPGVATRALELIGKHLGTFEPKVRDLEQRPAFVGISINMGDKPSVQVIHADSGATIGATKEVKDS